MPDERVRALMAGESAFDAELWRTLSDQGWVGLHLPESAGGLGLGLVELAVVVEEMGRACVPGPFLATLWAATLLADAGDPAAHIAHPRSDRGGRPPRDRGARSNRKPAGIRATCSSASRRRAERTA